MEDQEANFSSPRPAVGSSDTPAVRSRWTPKPEQILILESIFNSGMVNPPKDETIRIRKLLEKFGSVGDANVFYWFQNRRSRSRRRQRQIQAGLLQTPNSTSITTGAADADHTADISTDHHHQAYSPAAAVFHHYDQPTSSNTISVAGLAPSQHLNLYSSSSSSTSTSAGHGRVVNADAFFSIFQQMSLPDMDQNPILCPSSDMISSNLQYQSGSIVTVFINGIATEVPSGPFDLSTMFGQDHVMLVHSSTGVPVPVNEYGIIVQSLQMGESYFLVRLLKLDYPDRVKFNSSS